MDIEQISECPDCGSLDIVHDSRGQIICKECGLIYTPMKPLEEAFTPEALAKKPKVRPAPVKKAVVKKKAKKIVKPAKKKAAKKVKKKPAKAAKKVKIKKKAKVKKTKAVKKKPKKAAKKVKKKSVKKKAARAKRK